MVRITARHMAGGEKHEHIAEVKWTNPSTGKIGKNSRAEMVAWIEGQKGHAVCGEGAQQVDVKVVHATPKYIQTYADGKWTNNLLALPRY